MIAFLGGVFVGFFLGLVAAAAFLVVFASRRQDGQGEAIAASDEIVPGDARVRPRPRFPDHQGRRARS